ncbi:MAG: prolyl-tRNA synthetase associated domain-containing protein [Pseudomonadota bacterium]
MDIYQFLQQNRVAFEKIDHPPVYTCEQAQRLVPISSGKETKNLFVRDKKGRRHYLIIVGYDKNVDFEALSALLEVTRISLASPDRLKKYLGVDPGSVSLLSIVNDTRNAVEVVIDEEVWEAASIRCHPLVNTTTLIISKRDIEKILEVTGHHPKIMDIPGRLEAV